MGGAADEPHWFRNRSTWMRLGILFDFEEQNIVLQFGSRACCEIHSERPRKLDAAGV